MTITTQPAPLDLDALEKLHQAATPGPWRTGDGVFRRNAVLAQGSADTCPDAAVWSTIFHADLIEVQDSEGRAWYAHGTSENNATLIASARNALPALLAEARENRTSRDRIAELERKNAELREALGPFARNFYHDGDLRRAARLVSEPHGAKAPDHG